MKNISNPFTPKSGWEPRAFLGRKEEIEMFNKKFIQATEQLTTEVPRELPIKHEKLKNFIEYLRGFGISLPVVGGGIQIPMEVELRGDPQTLLLDSLISLWNDVKKETKVVVVLLDDVHNYSHISGFLTILKNVLSHDEIRDTGYLFVLSSTPDGWRQFLQRHHPIGRYFIPRLTLNNLSRDEAIKIVDDTLEGTGVVFDEEIKERVYDYTQGHPFELQLISSNLYDNQIGGRISDEIWDSSLDRTIVDLGENVLDIVYEKSSLQERKVLYIISSINKPLGVKDIMDVVEKNKLFREYILRYRGYDGNGSLLRLDA